MGIPVESRETEDFTPQSLESMGDDAPVFRLKAPSERCVRRFRQILGDDGLENFSEAEFTAEKMKALPLYWPEDVAVQYRDQLATIMAKQKQDIDLTAEEVAWAGQLDDQLFDAHQPLRVMRRKTGEFNEYAPRFAMAVYIAGWRNFGVPFRLDAGVIAAECVKAVAAALKRLGEVHCPDAPSTPFLELYVAASKRLRLDEEEEKNSPSPSPPTATQDASTRKPRTAAKRSIAERSKASPPISSSPPATILASA